jgi:hypothetical protein
LVASASPEVDGRHDTPKVAYREWLAMFRDAGSMTARVAVEHTEFGSALLTAT